MSHMVQMSGPMFHGGSPEQAHMMHAAQQGNMHPSYAMYIARMMYMNPQARPLLYIPFSLSPAPEILAFSACKRCSLCHVYPGHDVHEPTGKL